MQHFKCKSSQITQYWEPMNCRSLIGKCTLWASYLCQWNSRWWTELIISRQAGEDDEGESRRAEQRALHVITVFILFHRKTTWQSFAKTREKISHQFIRLCCLHLSLGSQKQTGYELLLKIRKIWNDQFSDRAARYCQGVILWLFWQMVRLPYNSSLLLMIKFYVTVFIASEKPVKSWGCDIPPSLCWANIVLLHRENEVCEAELLCSGTIFH